MDCDLLQKLSQCYACIALKPTGGRRVSEIQTYSVLFACTGVYISILLPQQQYELASCKL